MPPPDSALKSQVLAYLKNHHVVTLATHGPQGLWAAAVFYASDGLNLYFLSSPGSRHSMNIAANARIAATIQEDYKAWPDIKGIQLEGEAVRLEGAARATALACYGAKFPLIGNLAQAPLEIAKAMSKVAWYKLVPEAMHFIDNAQGFGHRESLPCDLIPPPFPSSV